MTVQTPDENRAMMVRMALSTAVDEFVTDVDPAAFEVRPPWPGAGPAWTPSKHPLPINAIQAGQVILAQAKELERRTLEHARGMGESWFAIGQALGRRFVAAAERQKMKLGLAAWRYAVFGVMPEEEEPYRRMGQDCFRWRCWVCSEAVIESHPDHGPEAEEGHAHGCSRWAARRKAGWQYR